MRHDLIASFLIAGRLFIPIIKAQQFYWKPKEKWMRHADRLR